MAAAVQTTVFKFASLLRLQVAPRPGHAPVGVVSAYEPTEFPEASAPTLPLSIRDEVLEHYAFTFCQRGFRKLGMTFEQFLMVAAAIKPSEPRDTGDDARHHECARFSALR
jgi:hypothetical protein